MFRKLYASSPGLQKFYRARISRLFNPWMRLGSAVDHSGDPVRYGAMALAIQRIRSSGVHGAFAELGVYRGDVSAFLCKLAPERKLYLFDTFAGFPKGDDDGFGNLFADTSLEAVKRRVNGNAVFRVGYFPETSVGLEDETFAFVSLDADLYNPMLAGFNFFWPRLSPGGYIFAHDYHSRYPVAQAVESAGITDFVELPDRWSSIVIRKPI